MNKWILNFYPPLYGKEVNDINANEKHFGSELYSHQASDASGQNIEIFDGST